MRDVNTMIDFVSAPKRHYLELRRAGASRNVAAAYVSTLYNVDGSTFDEIETQYQKELN